MLNRILPDRLDNDYEGHWAGLVVFGFVIISRAVQSLIVIFTGRTAVIGADGIPLDSYPAAAAQNLVAVYANSALARLFVMLIGCVVLLRYRRGVPAMFIVIALNFVTARLIPLLYPIARNSGAPAGLVNRILLALTIAGFALSVWRRGGRAATRVPAAAT